ncbi:MAG: site-2 protease family protein, partial [Firmicutes bacterium]|nr:site-2 protease family protein [Bacillota bacterium]
GVPVQIDPRYYKRRRTGELIVGLAGVTTNMAIAVAFSFLAKYMSETMSMEFYQGFGGILFDIVIYMVGINIVLMIFNLLPVPPLDGFGIVTQIFNLQRYSWYWTLYHNGSVILMIMIVFDLTSKIINPIYNMVLKILLF